jgi:hypothetical protein
MIMMQEAIRTVKNSLANRPNCPRATQEAPPFHEELALLHSGLDSLCFAILIARLEDQLGSDPLTVSDEVNFPVMLGDFVELCEDEDESTG